MSFTLTLPWPVGEKFGMLTVLERSAKDPSGRSRWLCRCDCGRQNIVAYSRLKSGHTKSCGCLRGKANFRHGAKGTPTHNTWCAMKQRCNDPNHAQFAYYGARGIRVCDRWATSFEAFISDMGVRPDGMTIERIESDGNYEPGNCRWATEAEQSRNRRSTILVTLGSETKCVKDWCDELGLNVDQVYGRIRRGAVPEEALR